MVRNNCYVAIIPNKLLSVTKKYGGWKSFHHTLIKPAALLGRCVLCSDGQMRFSIRILQLLSVHITLVIITNTGKTKSDETLDVGLLNNTDANCSSLTMQRQFDRGIIWC